MKISATPELLQLGDVLLRDRAAHHEHDVAGALLVEQLGDPRHKRHVRAGEDRQPDGVGVLLEHGLHDLLRRLVQARVDDLHARVAQRASDDLGAAVMPVEARLGHHHADLPAGGGPLGRCAGVGRHATPLGRGREGRCPRRASLRRSPPAARRRSRSKAASSRCCSWRRCAARARSRRLPDDRAASRGRRRAAARSAAARPAPARRGGHDLHGPLHLRMHRADVREGAGAAEGLGVALALLQELGVHAVAHRVVGRAAVVDPRHRVAHVDRDGGGVEAEVDASTPTRTAAATATGSDSAFCGFAAAASRRRGRRGAAREPAPGGRWSRRGGEALGCGAGAGRSARSGAVAAGAGPPPAHVVGVQRGGTQQHHGERIENGEAAKHRPAG